MSGKPKHTRYAPSSMKRILACSGSVALTPEPEVEETSYATEGTAAHNLIHYSWVAGCDPVHFQGQYIGDIRVDAAMVEGARLFLNRLHSEMERVEATTDDVYLEETIYHPDDEERGGTPDCVIIGRKGQVILDYKYGAGILVMSNDPQLMEYGCLVREKYGDAVSYRVVVIQPRRSNHEGPVRIRDLTDEDLDQHNDDVLRVQQCVEFGRINFTVGNHCWKCPAMGQCDAILTAARDFESRFNGDPMDAEKANEVLEKADAIKAFIKYCEEWEHRRLQSGGKPIHYYLRDSRSQNRFDIPEEQLVIRAVEAGLSPDVLYNKKLKTVNQLKKTEGVDPSFVDQVASIKQGAPKLSRLSEDSDGNESQQQAIVAFSDVSFPGVDEDLL